ncbi:MAG TPA: hypothetical protein VF092_10745 [Longimicrobium sp.]
MAEPKNVPWPVWAVVTVIVAAIPVYASLSGGDPKETEPADVLVTTYGPEVKAAIQRSFSIGTVAYLNSDTLLLSQIFSGEALRTTVGEVLRFRSAHVRLKRQIGRVVFGPMSFTRDPLRAEVRVTRTMKGQFEQIDSGVCTEALPTVTQEQTYYLERIDNAWMIYSVVAHTQSPITVPCPVVSGRTALDVSGQLPATQPPK